MFRTVKSMHTPSVSVFKSEFPQNLNGGLRQDYLKEGMSKTRTSVLSNPSTSLTSYPALFHKISKRNLS